MACPVSCRKMCPNVWLPDGNPSRLKLGLRVVVKMLLGLMENIGQTVKSVPV